MPLVAFRATRTKCRFIAREIALPYPFLYIFETKYKLIARSDQTENKSSAPAFFVYRPSLFPTRNVKQYLRMPPGTTLGKALLMVTTTRLLPTSQNTQDQRASTKPCRAYKIQNHL